MPADTVIGAWRVISVKNWEIEADPSIRIWVGEKFP